MRIKDAVRLTDLKWLNLFNVEFIDSGGTERKWQIATREQQPKCVTGRYDRPDAVVIVPFHTGLEKIVKIREYR